MRAEKQLLLDEIKDKMLGAKALLWTRYQALPPNVSSSFRLKLAESHGSFSIVRKRLLMKIAEEQGITLTRKMLEGHIGLVFAEDPVSATKTLIDFSKNHGDIFQILGGRLEGQVYSADDIKAISKLPSLEVMRAQFLGTLEAPMSQTLSVIESILTSIIYCLDNKSQENKEETK